MAERSAREYLEDLTLVVPDFPEQGILFRDLTPVFADSAGLRAVIDGLVEPFVGTFDAVAGIEARGFLLAAAAAYAQGTGTITIRKSGKLPGRIVSETYALEYGTATLEMHPDSFAPGTRVLLLDDVLATGGTLEASAKLIERCGGEVAGMSVALELGALGGRQRLVDRYSVAALQVV